MLNKAILMGRLTRDPELRTTPSGVNVCSFTLAIDRRFQRQGEERQTDFLNCIAFGQRADFVSKYFIKGQLAIVIGSIQTRSWDTPEGKRYATEIIADEINFAGSKKDNPTPSQSVGNPNDFMPQSAPGSDAVSGFMTTDDDDDELPF